MTDLTPATQNPEVQAPPNAKPGANDNAKPNAVNDNSARLGPGLAKTKGPTQPAEGPPKQPDQIGSQFAALGRREKAVRQQEQQLRAQQEQVSASLKSFQELENLSADEILERVAARKGIKPEEVLQSYIDKVTGKATSSEQALKDTKDPAVIALNKKLEEQARIIAEQNAKLEAKERAALEAQARSNVQAVQNECLQSANSAWTDESEFPLFFTDQADLSNAVFSFCAEQVKQYTEANGFGPEESDIEALIKAAPKLMIEDLLKTPRGQRLVALKSASSQQEPSIKPPLRNPSIQMKPVPRETEKPDQSSTQVRASTKYSNRSAIERARRTLPDRVVLTSGHSRGAGS